jgi:hypothetical protein
MGKEEEIWEKDIMKIKHDTITKYQSIADTMDDGDEFYDIDEIIGDIEDMSLNDIANDPSNPNSDIDWTEVPYENTFEDIEHPRIVNNYKRYWEMYVKIFDIVTDSMIQNIIHELGQNGWQDLDREDVVNWLNDWEVYTPELLLEEI